MYRVSLQVLDKYLAKKISVKGEKDRESLFTVRI